MWLLLEQILQMMTRNELFLDSIKFITLCYTILLPEQQVSLTCNVIPNINQDYVTLLKYMAIF